jgi:hypothetical protein
MKNASVSLTLEGLKRQLSKHIKQQWLQRKRRLPASDPCASSHHRARSSHITGKTML